MAKAAWLLFVLAVCGCSSVSQPKPQAHAYINDVAVELRDDYGYRLVAVDDKEPTRVTTDTAHARVVPYAIILPGHHTLTVERVATKEQPAETFTLSADLAVDTCYRFVDRDGKLTLVKDFD